MNAKVQAIYEQTVQQLTEMYGDAEAKSITQLLFEDFLHIPKLHRLLHPDLRMSDEQQSKYTSALKMLLNHKPIQQIIGTCHFYGNQFEVNEHTLIPRPETEELVDLIVKKNQDKQIRMLDIGTGSGCIAISLASALSEARVYAWDISGEALAVARRNAEKNEVSISFQQVDILKYTGNEVFDVIVSNPPYIPESERSSMARNVTDYEPEEALFVPDNDPLLFYREIGGLAKRCLSKNGRLYFEIHEKFGREVKSLLEMLGFGEVQVLKDLQGRDRIVAAKY